MCVVQPKLIGSVVYAPSICTLTYICMHIIHYAMGLSDVQKVSLYNCTYHFY